MVHGDSQISMRSLHLILYTCRLHVDDMFDEMHVMASRGLVMILSILLLLYPCYLVSLPILMIVPLWAMSRAQGQKRWLKS